MATPLDMDTPLAFNRPAKRVSYLIIINDMSLKLDTLRYISVAESLGMSLTVLRSAPWKLPNGSSKSPTMVPTESLYTTSY